MADRLSRVVSIALLLSAGLLTARLWPLVSWPWWAVLTLCVALGGVLSLIVFALWLEQFTRRYGREP